MPLFGAKVPPTPKEKRKKRPQDGPRASLHHKGLGVLIFTALLGFLVPGWEILSLFLQSPLRIDMVVMRGTEQGPRLSGALSHDYSHLLHQDESMLVCKARHSFRSPKTENSRAQLNIHGLPKQSLVFSSCPGPHQTTSYSSDSLPKSFCTLHLSISLLLQASSLLRSTPQSGSATALFWHGKEAALELLMRLCEDLAQMLPPG
ncbi:hypothetical protein ACQKWADRAFT_12807 [Trichoderma austrokoningii]